MCIFGFDEELCILAQPGVKVVSGYFPDMQVYVDIL